MSDAIRLTLPVPPSANRYWRQWRGRTVVSTEARNYKLAAGWIARQQGAAQPLTGLVKVSLWILRGRAAGDLDNKIKVAFDCLNGIVWQDDKQVRELHVYMDDDRKNPRMYVHAEELPSAPLTIPCLDAFPLAVGNLR